MLSCRGCALPVKSTPGHTCNLPAFAPDQEIPGPPPPGPRFPFAAESGNGDSLFPVPSPHLNWMYYYAHHYEYGIVLTTLYSRLLDLGEMRGGGAGVAKTDSNHASLIVERNGPG